MRIWTLCALAIAIFASGCVSKYQLTVDEYAAVAHRINLGDSKEQVLAILEPTQSRLDSSDRKYPVLCTRQGISVEIYYFRSGWKDDFLNTDDEYTPYVFNDEKLVAIGWEALGGPRLRSKVFSIHTTLIRTTWRNMCRRSYGIGILSKRSELSTDEMVLDRLDNDSDGIVDDMDKCPNTPMGIGIDAVGCPPDSDDDGVPDYLDKCNNTPTGANVNELGCWTLRAVVLFDIDSSHMKDEAYPLLHEVITILEKNPEIKVEIQGHTDNTGTAEYNLELSEKRAERIMDYLVRKGIESKRLDAKGYGLTQPVASNYIEEGRAQNRRVELKRVR